MALFSLLVAILVERLKLLPQSLQFDQLMKLYQQRCWGADTLTKTPYALLAIFLPPVVTFVVLLLLDGIFYNVISLCVWVLIAIICFNHIEVRNVFKKYVLAACRGDVQACYFYAGQLECHECLDAVNEKELGAKVGETVAWINYRYYGAVALFLIMFGPVGAVLYCSLRFYDDLLVKHGAQIRWVTRLMHAVDWLPSRIFSFGFALSGRFSEGISAWSRYSLSIATPTRKIITKTASASESMPEVSKAPICVQSTLALLALSKRNFLLLVTVLSVLTIFGVVN
ncbi:beta-lactamase regulator AmpE [Shewanella maritima]|uniref:beta-lactamase regulator AmpE n=1 Tax=Shewanella maritima TaxID=2520507 RepID=UPI00373708A3